MAFFRWQYLLLATVVIAAVTLPVMAQRVADAPDPNLPALKAMLLQPEKHIDLASAKLTIDHMIDPTINIEANLRKLDAMTSDLARYMQSKTSNVERTAVLQDYLYKPGPWNASRVFEYDLDDPFGENIRNKLLPTYLTTRRGNCISMPLLFVILGQKLGIDVTTATVPLHVFVKYRGDDGKYHNFEATSGGTIKDSELHRNYPMTKQALDNGLYLRPLSRKDTVIVMIEILLEHYKAIGLHEQRMKLAELILAHDPKSVRAMTAKGHAYYGMLKRDYLDRFPSPTHMPAAERERYQMLSRNNHLWYEKAEALGWREQDRAADTRYRKIIDQAKSERSKGEKQ